MPQFALIFPYHFVSQKRRRKAARSAVPDLPPSPWAVMSLTEFLHYNCPMCEFKCKGQSRFLDHAYDTHSESIKYLCMVEVDQMQEDYLEDDLDAEFNSLSWNANAICSTTTASSAGAAADAAVKEEDETAAGDDIADQQDDGGEESNCMLF